MLCLPSVACCRLPTADCRLCLLPPGSACVRKTPAPVSAMVAGCCSQPQTLDLYLYLKVTFCVRLAFGQCLLTHRWPSRMCVSIYPRPFPLSLLHSLSFATLFIHLALNSYASQRFYRSATSCTSMLHSCKYVSLSLCVSVSHLGATETTSSLDLPNATCHPLWADSRQAWLQIWLQATPWPAQLIQLGATQLHFNGKLHIIYKKDW